MYEIYGEAITFCEGLELDKDGDEVDDTDWHLPTQKELMQAYIDGIENNGVRPTGRFWSSTMEYFADDGLGWYTYLYIGETRTISKGTDSDVYCVHR